LHCGLEINRDHGIEALNRRLPLIKGIAQIRVLYQKMEDFKMKRTFEAVWEHGKVIPAELFHIKDHSRLLVIVLDEKEDEVQTSDWRNLRGKYSGKLSSVDNFILMKQEEKRLEK